MANSNNKLGWPRKQLHHWPPPPPSSSSFESPATRHAAAEPCKNVGGALFWSVESGESSSSKEPPPRESANNNNSKLTSSISGKSGSINISQQPAARASNWALFGSVRFGPSSSFRFVSERRRLCVCQLARSPRLTKAAVAAVAAADREASEQKASSSAKTQQTPSCSGTRRAPFIRSFICPCQLPAALASLKAAAASARRQKNNTPVSQPLLDITCQPACAKPNQTKPKWLPASFTFSHPHPLSSLFSLGSISEMHAKGIKFLSPGWLNAWHLIRRRLNSLLDDGCDARSKRGGSIYSA